MGLPWWLSRKESTCQRRRLEFNPWSRKIPWRRKWQPTSVFLLGKFRGQRSLWGSSPWDCKGSGMTERLDNQTVGRWEAMGQWERWVLRTPRAMASYQLAQSS